LTKGRTIYLLKQSSKPVPVGKKRRKIDLFALPGQPMPQQEEQKHEEPVDLDMADHSEVPPQNPFMQGGKRRKNQGQ
jgi:hypothetical protein